MYFQDYIGFMIAILICMIFSAIASGMVCELYFLLGAIARYFELLDPVCAKYYLYERSVEKIKKR